MSEEQIDTGSRDRATVALVNAKLDEVKAIVQGNAAVTDAHFETVRQRLDGLAGLSGRMDTLEQKYTALQAIVSEIERGRVYRTNTLPLILIGVGSLVVAIIALVIAGGGG
jgi:hypothetical protein